MVRIRLDKSNSDDALNMNSQSFPTSGLYLIPWASDVEVYLHEGWAGPKTMGLRLGFLFRILRNVRSPNVVEFVKSRPSFFCDNAWLVESNFLHTCNHNIITY